MTGAVFAAWWGGLSSRERVTLLAGAAFAILAGLYAFLWEPGMAARAALDASLPRLRAQVEDMRRQRREVLALRRELGGATRGSDATSLLRAAAAQSGLAVQRIDPLSEGRALMRAESVPFAAWLAWIESLQRQLGVRVESCQITALDGPGLVRIEAGFALADAPIRGSRR